MKTDTTENYTTATYQHQTSPEQIIHRILASGQITAADRAWFHRATLSDTTLNQQQLIQVRQVFDRLQMGLLKVVD
jgi:hypothetical protein